MNHLIILVSAFFKSCRIKKLTENRFILTETGLCHVDFSFSPSRIWVFLAQFNTNASNGLPGLQSVSSLSRMPEH